MTLPHASTVTAHMRLVAAHHKAAHEAARQPVQDAPGRPAEPEPGPSATPERKAAPRGR